MANTPPIEEYIQIYTQYHVMHLPAWEIARKHQCSDDKVWDAIKYVDEMTPKIPAESLLRGAVTSIKYRLRMNTEELIGLRKRKIINYPILIAFNREIRSDEQLLYNLIGLLENNTLDKKLRDKIVKEEVAMETPGITAWLERRYYNEYKERRDKGEIFQDLGTNSTAKNQ